MSDEIAKLLRFTVSGHEIDFSKRGYGHCNLSGYDDPEQFCARDNSWSTFNVPGGGVPVLDIRAAVETDRGYRWAIDGPMVDINLDNDEIDRLPDPCPLMAGALLASGNEFGRLLVRHEAHRRRSAEPGPLDRVSIAAYLRGWKSHGARIGRAFRNADGTTRIAWDD